MRRITEIIPALGYGKAQIEKTLRNNRVVDFVSGFGDLLTPRTIRDLSSISPQELRARFEKAKAESILELALFTSSRCNAKCRGCYTSERLAKDQLSLEQQKEIISQAQKLGARVVYTSGAGEPTVDPSFLKLGDYIRGKGMDWVVFSNGLVFCDDEEAEMATGFGARKFAEKIVERGITLVHKIWSSNGARNNELIGRQYSYDQVSNGRREMQVPVGIRILREAGIEPGKLCIETLCTSDSCTDVGENIIPYALHENLPLVINLLWLSGDAKSKTDLVVTQSQLRAIEEYVTNFGNRARYQAVVDNRGYVHDSLGDMNLSNPSATRKVGYTEGVDDLFAIMHSDRELVMKRHGRMYKESRLVRPERKEMEADESVLAVV